MKLKSSLVVVTISLMILVSCRLHNEQEVLPGQVSFSFKRSNSNTGRTKDQVTAAFVSYTLKKSDGTLISKQLALHEFNGEFVTNPETLLPGHYSLEQFLILDGNNHSIYASPLTGSDLANLVEHPLPLSFEVAAEETTNIVPEVLALGDYTSEDFGYAKFGFKVVKVATLKIPPFHSGTEELEKISYQFSNGTDIVKGEVSPQTLLTIPELLGKTWQTTIQLWVKKGCTQYQKLYRFTSELSFDGNVIQLPPFDPSNWKSLLYKGTTDFKFFFSADPRHIYHFEVHIISSGSTGRGTVDRNFWNAAEAQLCQTELKELYNADHSIIQVDFPLRTTCGEQSEWRYVDSGWSMTMNDGSTRQFYFSWDIVQDVATPSVCTPM